jgi:hypothetical protein
MTRDVHVGRAQSDRPQVIDEKVLEDGHNLKVAVRFGANGAAFVRSFVVRCLSPRWRVLQPGESVACTILASVGVAGWHISEPGSYVVRVALQSKSVRAISNPLQLRVAIPRDAAEEHLAQDYFTDDIGRALAFSGVAEGNSAYVTLQEISTRLSKHKVARHALVCLGIPKLNPHKVLKVQAVEQSMASVWSRGGCLQTVSAQVENAQQFLRTALRPGDGLDTFGLDQLARINSQFI